MLQIAKLCYKNVTHKAVFPLVRIEMSHFVQDASKYSHNSCNISHFRIGK